MERDRLMPIAVSVIISLIVVILCVIYLMAVTGKIPEDNEVHLASYADRIYSDIQLGILLITLYFGFMDYTDFLDIIATEMS